MNSFRLLKPFLLLLFISCSMLLHAQTTVTGVVTDKETGKPMEGVTVKVKNNPTATTTAADGSFSIKVPSPEAILTFTSVNHMLYEIRAGNGPVNITLAPTNAKMDEVIVIGYGSKRKVNVLGSVGSIKAEEVEDIPVANLGAALINRVPGVSINTASGKPGATTSINIRNATVFNGASLGNIGVTSEPLYVIDGLIVTKQDFDNLDASMVESINFLKDASAAIYGAAGSHGVVLVTTKRGRVGKPRISYSGYFGNSDASVKPKVMSAYQHAKMLNDGYELSNAPLTSRFSQADLDFLATQPYKSWYDELWHSSNMTRHTINVSGGSERITFFAGGNYYTEGGNYGGIDIQKYGIRTGMNAKITQSLSADISFNSDYSYTNRNTLKGAQEETDDLSIRALFLTPQWVPLTINGLPTNWNGPNPPGAWNPVGLENSGNYKWNKSQGLSLNASLEFKPEFIKGLTAKVQYGKLNRNSTHKEYFPPYKVYNFVRTGQNQLLYSTTPTTSPTSNVSNSDQLGQSATIAGSYQLIGTLSYARRFSNNHDFDIMIGADQTKGESENNFWYKNGQLVGGVDEFWAFSNTGQTIRNPEVSQSVKRSYLGRMNYSFMNRYLLEVIARYDASAKFAPDQRWGLFPSVGIGWKISDEGFFRNLSFINFMKIRANYGLTGEDRINAALWKERYTQTTGMLIGATPTNGLDPSIFANPDITWEKARSLNVGFDATVFTKFNITVDIYQRYTYDGYDKLENGAIPFTSGINTAAVNYGEQLAWGSEFSIGYRTRFGKDFGFSADLNFGFSNSMLLQSYYNTALLGTNTKDELGIMIGRDPKKYNGSNQGFIAKGIIRTQADLDALLAKNPNYRINGVKPQLGFMDFEDINGDGQINDNDITLMFDKTTPVTSGGLTLGFTYKNFKLNTNINYVIGGKKFYDSEAMRVPTTTQNAPAFWNDHWTPENPDAKYPRADAPLARENSSFWAVGGTQIRVNNLVLSYSLPKTISEKHKIPEFRAFLTGTNLWNLVNPFDYKDPYTSNFASYPTMRTISLGVNVSM